MSWMSCLKRSAAPILGLAVLVCYGFASKGGSRSGDLIRNAPAPVRESPDDRSFQRGHLAGRNDGGPAYAVFRDRPDNRNYVCRNALHPSGPGNL